jgi:hypothetical protein
LWDEAIASSLILRWGGVYIGGAGNQGRQKVSGDGIAPPPLVRGFDLVHHFRDDPRADRLASLADGKAAAQVEGHRLIEVHKHHGVLAR